MRELDKPITWNLFCTCFLYVFYIWCIWNVSGIGGALGAFGGSSNISSMGKKVDDIDSFIKLAALLKSSSVFTENFSDFAVLNTSFFTVPSTPSIGSQQLPAQS